MSPEESRTGRPRDPERDAAILMATLQLLGEVRYDDVTVRTIAQRAGAGLATIYRRWPTKEDLVVDAMATYRPPPDPRPGAGPEESLIELIGALVEMMQDHQRGLIPNVIGQMQSNPRLAETLRERVILPRLAIAVEHLRAVPGVDPGRVSRAAELIPAWVILQIVILGRTLTSGDVRMIVDLAIRAAR